MQMGIFQLAKPLFFRSMKVQKAGSPIHTKQVEISGKLKQSKVRIHVHPWVHFVMDIKVK